MRWVLRYVPEYERRWSRFARSPGSSWRMDETAVSVRGGRHYLYRAVDRDGKSVASLLCNDRSMEAAQAFVRSATKQDGVPWPEKINVDGNSATHRGLRLLAAEDLRWRGVEVRARRYLNNVVEQDHRAIKRRCAPMLGLKSFRSAAITLAGIEARPSDSQAAVPLISVGEWAAALSAALAGSTAFSQVTVTGTTGPPPLIAESQPPSPGAGYVWIGGNWTWSGRSLTAAAGGSKPPGASADVGARAMETVGPHASTPSGTVARRQQQHGAVEHGEPAGAASARRNSGRRDRRARADRQRRAAGRAARDAAAVARRRLPLGRRILAVEQPSVHLDRRPLGEQTRRRRGVGASAMGARRAGLSLSSGPLARAPRRAATSTKHRARPQRRRPHRSAPAPAQSVGRAPTSEDSLGRGLVGLGWRAIPMVAGAVAGPAHSTCTLDRSAVAATGPNLGRSTRSLALTERPSSRVVTDRSRHASQPVRRCSVPLSACAYRQRCRCRA